MPHSTSNSEQYEHRTLVSKTQIPTSPRNFICVNRIKSLKSQTESVDVRRFYIAEKDGELRPTSAGVHIHVDLIADVLAGMLEALTAAERKAVKMKLEEHKFEDD